MPGPVVDTAAIEKIKMEKASLPCKARALVGMMRFSCYLICFTAQEIRRIRLRMWQIGEVNHLGVF